jgi:hypothetical protein
MRNKIKIARKTKNNSLKSLEEREREREREKI